MKFFEQKIFDCIFYYFYFVRCYFYLIWIIAFVIVGFNNYCFDLLDLLFNFRTRNIPHRHPQQTDLSAGSGLAVKDVLPIVHCSMRKVTPRFS